MGSQDENNQVRLAKKNGKTKTGNDIFTAINLEGKPSKNWVVLHQDYETFKQILGTVYTETSAKDYHENEAAGIYSIMKNRSVIVDIEIGPELFIATGIYGWKDSTNSPVKLTTQQIIDGKLGIKDKKYKEVFKGLIKAIVKGIDYSGGATVWQGNDFSLKDWKAYKNYYLVGFQFTDTKHDIYNMGNHPNNDYTISGIVDGQKVDVNLRYRYYSTGAAGGTIFMIRSWWSFADNNENGKPNFPVIQQYYLKNRNVLTYEEVRNGTDSLVKKYVKGIANF